MAPIPNPRVIYVKPPADYPIPGETLVYESDAETIDLDTVPLNGGVLAKTLYLSVDPYMRGRMRDPKIWSYAPTFDVGKPGAGAAVLKVLRSESPKYKAGDHIATFSEWKAYVVLPEAAAGYALESAWGVPWASFLSVAGGVAQTAYYSLREYAHLKEGETIFVSTAAGAVGTIVVQLAKLQGAKVIGATGSDEKVKYLKEELGVDVAFNYKTESVWDVLKEHGPIDVYYDMVGGELADAALLYATPKTGRIVCCGYASEYNNEEPYGIKNFQQVVTKSLQISGFIAADLIKKYGFEPFFENYLPLVRDGKIKHKEDKTYGLENLADALLNVLHGKNQGKAFVVVAED